MGLAEKRAIADLTTNKFPQWKQRLQTAAGVPLDIEVKWETLATDGYAHLYSDWEKVFIDPMEKTLKSICQDQMGKDALKEKFNKVVIQNTKDGWSGQGSILLEGKNIILDHALTNVDSYDERSAAWTEIIEKAL